MIRALLPGDAGHCAQLHGLSFETAWDEAALLGHIERDFCYGVFTPLLSGFIIISRAADQAEILTFVIDPDLRRQGLAKQLLNGACENMAQRGVDVLFLEVAEDNHGAIALYQMSGFTPIGRRPGYYRRASGRIAALTYRKDLLN